MSGMDSPIRLFQPAHSPTVEQAALDILRSGQIASGPKVPEFERALGDLVGRPDVVTTSDMTTALRIALHLAGVGPGDEVITLAFSCMSSNSPIARAGARAVWVDIDPETASMSIDDVKRALSPRTKAVMLYHVSGYPGPAHEVAALCRDHGIALIEDCNNAFGALQDGAPVGGIGDYAVYSFYPNRQIHAIEGGALVCPNAEIARHAMRLRRFGIDGASFRDPLGEINAASDIPEVGWSASLNQLNAAVGLAQLPSLAAQRQRTLDHANTLHGLASGLRGVRPVRIRPGAEPAYWGFLLLAERRDKLLAELKGRGVHASRLHHRNDDYSGFHSEHRALPGTDAFMAQVLAIPCGWWLTTDDVERLGNVLHQTRGT